MKPDSQTAVKTTPSIKRSYRRRSTRQLEIDIEKYQALLDDPRLDAGQKEDFLASLWSIIVAFIDLGYRVHPVQQAVDDFPIGEDMNREIIRTVEEFWREAASQFERFYYD